MIAGRFSFFLTSLKVHVSFKNSKFLVEKKLKTLHKYCSVSIRATLSAKFVLQAKLQNSAS